MKDSHCSYCGAPFAPNQPWPRTCAACGEITFRNPLPIVVVLQPVGRGVLVVRRAIEPGIGKLALPGGYIDYGESWQQAGARELREETGLEIAAGTLQPFLVASNPQGSFLMVFALAPVLAPDHLPPFGEGLHSANPEVQECLVVFEPVELAFPLHTQVLAQYFEREAGGNRL